MNASERIVAALRSEEDLRLEAYDDETGKPVPVGGKVLGTLTIGWGHTGPDVHPGQRITEEEAEQLFRVDVADAERIVLSAASQWLTRLAQHQFDALVSLAYNAGNKPFKKGTGLRAALDEGRYGNVPTQIRRWHWSNGKPNVLNTRRAREAKLWLEGVYPGEDEPALQLRTLSRGHKGKDVRALQDRFDELGLWPKDAQKTGYFGEITENVVRGFQHGHGLTVDGIVGPKTRAALAEQKAGA